MSTNPAYERYQKMPNAEVPPELQPALATGGRVTPLSFERREQLLLDPALHKEAGYTRLANGDWLVAMWCPMPGITAEMIDWWFWWHPRENARYQLWFPGEHYAIRTAHADAAYFGALEQPPFQPNTQYPVERIGGVPMPLRIDFQTPEDFGFSPAAQQSAQVAAVVCGQVGAFGGLFYHTQMAHVYFQRDGGLFMTSRFWIGQLLENRLLRRAILGGDGIARGMATHCCVEYRNLAAKLPELYREFA